MIDSLGLFRGGFGGNIRNVQEQNPADVTTLLSAGKDPQAIDLRSINFFSPVSELDVNTRLLVLQYRDAISGDVIRQYPTEGRLRAYTDGAAIIPADIAGFNTKNQPDAPVPENPALKPIIVRQSEELAAVQQGADRCIGYYQRRAGWPGGQGAGNQPDGMNNTNNHVKKRGLKSPLCVSKIIALLQKVAELEIAQF